eukprot:COSAG04_NODE_1392_length_6955_cov_22.011960_4_plen_177_part_00
MDKIYHWVRSFAEDQLEYGLFSSAAEQQAEQRPEPPQDAAPAPATAAAATSVELATGTEHGGATLCLVTGEVFESGPFEKPAKVARQRPKKGQPQRIGWRQGNSFAPLLALGGGLPEERFVAAAQRHKARPRMFLKTCACPIWVPQTGQLALTRLYAGVEGASQAPKALQEGHLDE